MQRHGSLPPAQLAADLPVGAGDAVVRVIHIDKEEGVTPGIGAEHLHGGCPMCAATFGVVEGVAKVVVHLHVLRLRGEACCRQQEAHGKKDV